MRVESDGEIPDLGPEAEAETGPESGDMIRLIFSWVGLRVPGLRVQVLELLDGVSLAGGAGRISVSTRRCGLVGSGRC